MFQQLDALADQLRGGFSNPCQVGHADHEFKRIVTAEGNQFIVFDWERYADSIGFCPADDAVSQSIEKGGGWELHITKVFDKVLRQSKDGVVIDMGAQIGWYSRRAVDAGWLTLGVEANGPTYELMTRNVAQSLHPEQFIACHGWIGQQSIAFNEDLPVKLIKIDIEGAEQYAVSVLERLFLTQQIQYSIIEISPIFNDSYYDLVSFLLGLGHKCWRINPSGTFHEWTVANLEASLYEFTQCDVLFQSPKAVPIV